MDVWLYTADYFGEEPEVYASAEFAIECTPESWDVRWQQQPEGNWTGHVPGRSTPVARLTRYRVLGS